ncbi:GNAT family N-acetyltransferase [Flexibacterium corallicola]|uniref:GNAT family N-acetyltransferase n=1 Tax=Flexibacterium corallicola TaxID=3037259 RepID=UPI00286ECFB0|nr:N-acetyltransferase [Pseudovibrio sp. M1P-2-3]
MSAITLHLDRDIHIRAFEAKDQEQVFELDMDAFHGSWEAQLAKDLRECGASILELVAVGHKDQVESGEVIGHLMASRVTGGGKGHLLDISVLTPVSVCPHHQHRRVGTAMIIEAIDHLQRMDEDLILALGPPEYFPRFGFKAELAKRLQGPYAGPVFSALALTQEGKQYFPFEVSFPTPFEDLE